MVFTTVALPERLSIHAICIGKRLNVLAAAATLATPLMGGEPDLVVNSARSSLVDVSI